MLRNKIKSYTLKNLVKIFASSKNLKFLDQHKNLKMKGTKKMNFSEYLTRIENLEEELKEKEEVRFDLIQENVLLRTENRALKETLQKIYLISSIYKMDSTKKDKE